jgi:hypothetical protein
VSCAAPQPPPPQGLALPGLADNGAALAAAEAGVRQDALSCLANTLEALWHWYRCARGGRAHGARTRALLRPCLVRAGGCVLSRP